MTSEEETQPHEYIPQKPRQKKPPAIIRALRALKHHIDSYYRRITKGETEHDRNERTLARWTRRMGIFSFALVTVSIATAVIFWRQLNVMQGQLNEMQASSMQTDQAIAASNRLADAAIRNTDAFINSERGRLLIGTVTLNKTTENDPQPHVDFTWANMGRNPVVLTEILLDCRIIGEQVPSNPIYDESKIRRGQNALGSGALGGTVGVPFPIPPCTLDRPLTTADWEALSARHEFILLSGFIRYEDAFHKYRWGFGTVYFGDVKFFSTFGLPEAYNFEIQEH